jgi:hypothetical protein
MPHHFFAPLQQRARPMLRRCAPVGLLCIALPIMPLKAQPPAFPAKAIEAQLQAPIMLKLADNLRITGIPEQGGFMIGQTDPGTHLWLDDISVPVSKTGIFTLGFGRNHGEIATLIVQHGTKGSSRKSYPITITPRHWQIERINGLPKKHVSPDPQALEKIRADAAAIRQIRSQISDGTLFMHGFKPPAKGRISGVFGSQRILNGAPRSPHSGQDIAAKTGTPVFATAPGTVSLVDNNMLLMGKTVMVDHGLGVQSVYIHLHTVAVQPGQQVSAASKIGTIGATGRATGPHLHWGVSWKGTKLDPATVLKAWPVPAKE